MPVGDISPRALTVTIDMDAPLPDRYLGHSEDGEGQYGPTTLLDAIIVAATHTLVGHGEKVVREFVVERMQERIAERVDEMLEPLIAATFEEPIVVGDGFAQSKTTTLRELVGKRIEEQCVVKGRDSYSLRDTVASEVVRKQIDYSLTEIFTKEVNAAKADLHERLKAKAAEYLADTAAKAVKA